MPPALLETLDVESSNDPFSRWLSRAPELTRLLGIRVRLSLEPAILSRGFSRTLFTRGNRDLKTLPFEIVFERYMDSVCQNIGVRFEKRFRPLFTVDVEDSRREKAGPPYYPAPRLVRSSSGGFGSWYGIQGWQSWSPFSSEQWKERKVDEEVQLAYQHLSQVFGYLDRGTIGPNLEILP